MSASVEPIKLIADDPATIAAELKSAYESATGRTVYPGQAEQLLIDICAYRESLCRAAINEAARQNLVAFARAPMLDYLGELVGVARLPGEDDERLRERIRLAPEHFSVAGPRLAYRYHAMTADASITDVAVRSPEPGLVVLHPLTAAGLPSADIKARVLAAASAEDVRPLCDTVEVADPVDAPYTVEAVITPYGWADRESVRAAALAAVTAFCATKAQRLGRDVTRSALIAALHVPGVKRVALAHPAADITADVHHWTNATSIAVTATEPEDE